MPIYEYRCADCGHELEAMQKLSEPTLTDCPACGKPALKKLISAAGFQLKGSGWYASDFKNSGKPNTTDTASPDKSESATDTKKAGGCGHGSCGCAD
jgi:putative FmdB family regulatory protein